MTEARRARDLWIVPGRRDPRWVFALFLGSYVALGHLVLSFNRAPLQIAIAILACTSLDMLYTWIWQRKLLVPLSALISAFALSILFTAPGNSWLMLLAAWLSISSKYLITWQGRHVFNPTNFGLVMILLLSGQRAAIAPAYQWGGSTQIVLLVLGLGLLIMVWVRRAPLVMSFWAVFALGALLRSALTHLPVSFTLLASLSGGAFMLFSFYMITDPKTSPSTTKGMIAFGALIGTVDLIFQLMTTVFSFIYALFAVSAVRWLVLVLSSRRTSLSHRSRVPMMPGSVGT